MLNKLREKNALLEQKFLEEKDDKNVAIQRVISQLLKDDECFLKISIEKAYTILRELNVKPEMYEQIYFELTKPKNWQKASKSLNYL